MITFFNNTIASSILDNDALLFIKEAKISDANQIKAINELCRDLKREGFWDSIFRAFPFVWNGTTASVLVELKTRGSANLTTSELQDPQISNNGIKFTGGNWFTFGPSQSAWSLSIDSNIGPASLGHISFYSRTATFSASEKFGGIYWQGSTSISSPNYTGRNQYSFYSTSNSTQSARFTFSLGDWATKDEIRYFGATSNGFDGLFILSNSNDNGGFTATNTRPYLKYVSRNDEVFGTYSSNLSIADGSWGSPIVISNISNGGVGGATFAQGNFEICWYSVGGGRVSGKGGGSFIPQNRVPVFYNIINKFQNSLGRGI